MVRTLSKDDKINGVFCGNTTIVYKYERKTKNQKNKHRDERCLDAVIQKAYKYKVPTKIVIILFRVSLIKNKYGIPEMRQFLKPNKKT
jgi:hypothetical protein